MINTKQKAPMNATSINDTIATLTIEPPFESDKTAMNTSKAQQEDMNKQEE